MSLWYASRLALHRIAARLTYASGVHSSPSAFYAVSDFLKMQVRRKLSKAASLNLGSLIRPFMLRCNKVLVLHAVLGGGTSRSNEYQNLFTAGLPCREPLVNENDFVIDNAANSGEFYYVN